MVNILDLAVDSKFTKNELVNLLWQKLKNGQNLKHKINSSKFWGAPEHKPTTFTETLVFLKKKHNYDL